MKLRVQLLGPLDFSVYGTDQRWELQPAISQPETLVFVAHIRYCPSLMLADEPAISRDPD